MAGWQPYADLLKSPAPDGSGCTDRGGIFGQDGSTWAVIGGTALTPDYIKALAASVQAGSKPAAGLAFNDTNFMFLGAANGILTGKKGDSACAVGLSGKAVVVAVSVGTPQDALKDVLYTIEQLKSKGF